MEIYKVYYYAIVRFNYNNKTKSYEGDLFDFNLDVNKIYINYFKNYVYFNIINSTENEYIYNNNYPKLFYIVGFQSKPNKNLNFNLIFNKFPKYCIYVDFKNNQNKGYLGNRIKNNIYQDMNNIHLFSNINTLQSFSNDYKYNIDHCINLSMNEFLEERRLKYKRFCFNVYETKDEVSIRLILNLINYK
jgi:hypothetical protein